jgi:flagellar export protein FliJ
VSFHSPFDFLLRVYRAREEREQAKLQMVIGQLARVRGQLEECTAAHLAIRVEVCEQMQVTLPAAGLHFESDCADALVQRAEMIEDSIRQLTNQVEAQRKTVLQLQQQRRAIESLRDQQYSAWKLDQMRREQKSMDELFLMRRQQSRPAPRE